MSFTEEARIIFLAQTRFLDMVICPEGNRFDTHRFWETLYMSGVPVVVANPYLGSLFQGFPCFVLNSWFNLFYSDLIFHLWQMAESKSWDTEAPSFDFWKGQIVNKQFELSGN
jgi:hypothetical protein